VALPAPVPVSRSTLSDRLTWENGRPWNLRRPFVDRDGGGKVSESRDDCGADVTTVKRWTGREARLLRHALRLSVREFADDVGVDPRTISKWESGSSARTPRPELQRALDTMLRRASGEERERFHVAACAAPVHGDTRLAAGTAASEAQEVASAVPLPQVQPWAGGHATITPKPVGCRPAGPSERELVAMAAQRARKFTLSNESAVSAESVEQVYDDVRRLAVAYPQRPLPEILGELVEVQDNTYELLEHQQRPQQARDLYLLAGVVGGLLAKASHDLAEPHAAMTQARAAFVCADNAEHDGLRAWLRGLQALIAYWADRPSESVRYAQSGAEYATRGHGTAAVWLAVSEARGLAALGSSEGTLAAIERAERGWDEVQPNQLDELGGICTFNRSRQIYYAADALTWLPDQGVNAESYSNQAVQAYGDSSSPEWAFGDQAGAHTDLAIARVARGELDGAREAINLVLDLAPERRINGIIRSVQRMQGALRGAMSAEVGQANELRDQIEAFTRTPVAALPR